MARHGPRPGRFVLNCEPSTGVDTDWTFEDAVGAGMVSGAPPRAEVDLRRPDWPIRDQCDTGACVGFATADGVLHWHYRQAGLLAGGERPSPRFIWMANKETDLLTSFPTTFIESAGTQIKLALRVARKYGCVTESTLPMDGALSSLSTEAFYARAAKYRIASYHNLGRDPQRWRAWISNQGPVLVRVVVDRTWERAAAAEGELERYREDASGGGHAACLVGYTATHFIVRNSWGERWGDRGFGYASDAYAASAFDEAYGAVL
jgi:hypothetical protein